MPLFEVRRNVLSMMPGTTITTSVLLTAHPTVEG